VEIAAHNGDHARRRILIRRHFPIFGGQDAFYGDQTRYNPSNWLIRWRSKPMITSPSIMVVGVERLPSASTSCSACGSARTLWSSNAMLC
jgi:hypothetical protein